MNTGRTFAALLAVGLAACGGQPEAPAPSSTQLGYSLPETNPLVYASADTARVNIEVQPGMAMEQTMGQNSRVRLSFAPTMGTAGNLTVTASYVDFVTFMESSMMPRQEVGIDAVQGDFVLSVTPRGKVEQVSGPELPEEVKGMMMGQNMFSDFFVRLPDRVVGFGEAWTDTVSAENEMDGTRSVNNTVIVSSVRGDTTVAGRTLWIIESNKASSVLVEGNMQGMSMRNELSGSVQETTLWDPARRIVVSVDATGSMTGTVSMPDAGMQDIPLTVTNTRHVRLVEGGS